MPDAPLEQLPRFIRPMLASAARRRRRGLGASAGDTAVLTGDSAAVSKVRGSTRHDADDELSADSLKLSITYRDRGDRLDHRVTAQVPGTYSLGRRREEARANMIDALKLTLAGDDRSQWFRDPRHRDIPRCSGRAPCG